MFDSKQLAKWLREAKKAHQEAFIDPADGRNFEPPDHDWAEWYAEWLLPKLEADTLMTVIETVFPELDPRNLNDAKGGMKL